MLFKTSMDKTAVTITVLITILFAVIIGSQYWAFLQGNTYRPVYIIVSLLLIYLLAFAFHPSGYKITADAFVICRPVSSVRINRADIKSVAIIDKKEIKGTIRTFGVGGLFGYYGTFANFKLGSMTWYATRRNNTVLITTARNKKIVVTPNDPESFLAAFNA